MGWGWLGKYWSKIKEEAPVEMTVYKLPSVPGVRLDEAMEPDECYVELYVESLRLEAARRFTTKFSGVVYSFAGLVRQGDTKAELAAVTKPDKLTEIDPSAVDKVITISKQMMGSVPWRGGNFNLQLGLFSVKSGDLLSPVLNFVTKVSDTAGISFIGAVKPFLPLITEGMNLLTGQTNDTAVEVAIDQDLALDKSCAYALIAVPKGEVLPSDLTVDPEDRKLVHKGGRLPYGYCVISIRRTLQKVDFGEIPELKESWAAVMAAIRTGKAKDAEDALAAFRFITLASPDLITADALRLVEKATAKVNQVFKAGGVSLSQGGTPDIPVLADIDLYATPPA